MNLAAFNLVNLQLIMALFRVIYVYNIFQNY